MDVAWQKIGAFRGVVNPLLDSPHLRASLVNIRESLSAPEASLLQAGRHRTTRFVIEGPRGPLDAVAKAFGPQSLPKDLWDRVHGTKAFRTYSAAAYLLNSGIGTTPPVACLERWRFGKLTESYFVSLYMDDTVCCKDLLGDLWQRHAPYADFKALMRNTARGIRRLHDCGCRHGDLGNQNLFFSRRTPSSPYEDAVFIDLNRARFGHPLDIAERALDLCRIVFPPGFMPTFFRLYWEGDPPADFMREWERCHRRFRLHTATRHIRHPFRELRYRLNPKRAPAQVAYPPLANQWIWDAEAFRPATALPPRLALSFLDRNYRRQARRDLAELRQWLNANGSAGGAARIDAPLPAPPLFRLIVDGREQFADADLARLREAGVDLALVRFTMADDDATTAARIRGARRLRESGVKIAALVAQVPRFLDAGFAAYANHVAEELGPGLDWIVAGQGLNTVEWGVRGKDDAAAVISAGERLVFDRPARSLAVAASAVEAPVVQLGCGNIPLLFERNVRYSALTLAWAEGRGDPGAEARALHALAARTFYARHRVLLVSDSPWRRGCKEEADFGGLVAEVCAVAFT